MMKDYNDNDLLDAELRYRNLGDTEALDFIETLKEHNKRDRRITEAVEKVADMLDDLQSTLAELESVKALVERLDTEKADLEKSIEALKAELEE